MLPNLTFTYGVRYNGDRIPYVRVEGVDEILKRTPGKAAREAKAGEAALPAHGLVIRAVSRKERSIRQGLMAFWQAAKRELYGQDAVPPRKVN